MQKKQATFHVPIGKQDVPAASLKVPRTWRVPNLYSNIRLGLKAATSFYIGLRYSTKFCGFMLSGMYIFIFYSCKSVIKFSNIKSVIY